MSACIINEEILTSIEKSVLCWLATSSSRGQPNVSPKEIFCAYGPDQIIIANIASPQSANNIKENPLVCISFIDILVQKGYQIKGKAQLVLEEDEDFATFQGPLFKMAGEKFPFKSIISIRVLKVKPILAPSYMLYPKLTMEKDQIVQAKKAYKV